jgi:hypothetical protein
MVNLSIKVTPVQHGNGPIVWQMSHGATSGGPGNYPHVPVPKGSSGDFEITIVNPNGITFSNDPIWIKSGTAKPAPHATDPQITNISGGGTTVLKFHDANIDPPVTLTYQLNFNSGVPPIDPIIENGGGGGQGMYNYAVYAGVALVVAALLVFLFRNSFNKPVPRPTGIDNP